MQGPSEFGISGKLENWDRKADLKKVKIPTLVIRAKHDTMDQSTWKKYRKSYDTVRICSVQKEVKWLFKTTKKPILVD